MAPLSKLTDRIVDLFVPKAEAEAAACTWRCRGDCQVWYCCLLLDGREKCVPYGGDGCC